MAFAEPVALPAEAFAGLEAFAGPGRPQKEPRGPADQPRSLQAPSGPGGAPGPVPVPGTVSVAQRAQVAAAVQGLPHRSRGMKLPRFPVTVVAKSVSLNA